MSEARSPMGRLVRPFQEFAAREASGGIVLLACTLIALVWANSPWADSYAALWHLPLGVGAGAATFTRDLHFWVNDGLMAVFFFVVGLEIKRELRTGELASPRQAALPIAAALGGVAVPALLYALFNAQGAGAGGWGIPMATDIAFVIGVMALLGDRVPAGLKVFLTALAIVDDIAAVVVIAIFYTAGIDTKGLGLAVLCFAVLMALNRLGARHALPYALVGIVMWLAVLESGVHSTIAGILLAFAIPSRTAIDPPEFLRQSRAILDYFERSPESEQQAAIEALEDGCEKVQPPLLRFEHALHPWVTFAVIPLFALANAGVDVFGDPRRIAADPITMGVLLGLLIGKPAGIMAASWLAVRLGWAALPEGVSWRQIHGAGWLGGIGFTMSLFVAGLSFQDDVRLTAAKLGILGASLLAGIAGSFLIANSRTDAAPRAF